LTIARPKGVKQTALTGRRYHGAGVADDEKSAVAAQKREARGTGRPESGLQYGINEMMDAGACIRCPGCGFYENEFAMIDGICWACHQELHRMEV